MFTDNDAERFGIFLAGLLVLGLSVSAPGFVADLVGLRETHDVLVDWAQNKPLWLLVPLALAYLALGFFMVLAAGTAVFTAAIHISLKLYHLALRVLDFIHVKTVQVIEGSLSLLSTGATLVSIPLSRLAGYAKTRARKWWDARTRKIREAIALHRLYRKEYRHHFETFEAFRQAFNQAGSGNSQESSQRQHRQSQRGQTSDQDRRFHAALKLFGLKKTCTKADLIAAYKRLMKKAHPDLGGPHQAATDINEAYQIIKGRKGWT